MYNYVFAEKKMDSFERMQLLDLARTLTRLDDVKLETGFYSYFDADEHIVSVAHFWEDYNEKDRLAGRKSDVFLRSIGNAWFSDRHAIEQTLKQMETIRFGNFSKQLFAICEDYRLQQLCITLRPGTIETFQKRNELHAAYYSNRLRIHVNRNEKLDMLLVLIYLRLLRYSSHHIVPFEDSLMVHLQELNDHIQQSRSTSDIGLASLRFVTAVGECFDKDMVSNYFSILPKHGVFRPMKPVFKEEVKRHQLENDDKDSKPKNNSNKQKEKMSTWHRETSNEGDAMLNFDLNRGTRTHMSMDSIRESDEADGELNIVFGSSRNSNNTDFSLIEAEINRVKTEGIKKDEEYGRENKDAKAIFLGPKPIDAMDRVTYKQWEKEVSPFSRSLVRTIQRSLEHKRNAPRSNAKFGRIQSKSLVRIMTDKNANIFYKKDDRSYEIDACFLLLVDCSASMFDKMEETKRGIILFHEALRALRIPHAVTGFWEDADGVASSQLPNMFKTVIDFPKSLNPGHGPSILQLSPEQDNRDGYAIRVVSKRLLERQEKQKVLLVFSDGAPSAARYNENGIMDTYGAVTESRRLGIEIINVLLGAGSLNENDRKTMHAIYGNHSVSVTDVSSLNEHLKPLLLALLQRMIS